MQVTVTGGAGYVGTAVVRQLLEARHDVTVLDVLLHGQEQVAEALERVGARMVTGDIRDPSARRAAVSGAESIVHLAAIVGDPACSREPRLSQSVNVDAVRALLSDAQRAGVDRFIFASTCSNYGRMADAGIALDEAAELRPVSLYARQKVTSEAELMRTHGTVATTCLRFATVYGLSARMRFDLTVNEFTRDLWSGRRLEVYGDHFWRPYVHVRDAARAVALTLSRPREQVAGSVFNVGHTDENYTKRNLVEQITARLGRGDVSYVRRDEDPRDYRVSFDKIRDELGYSPSLRVADGIHEIIEGLELGLFADPFSPIYGNVH